LRGGPGDAGPPPSPQTPLPTPYKGAGEVGARLRLPQIKSHYLVGQSQMEIVKSSRHGKVIGSFGENIICNWLSRSGFEVIIVDHIGLDIIAYNPLTEKRLGITVKSRTRIPRLEEDSVNIFSYQKAKNDRQKLLDACQAFACEPWIAIYVETSKFADIYLTSLNHYDTKYRGKIERAIDDWKMKNKYKEIYQEDVDVKHIRIEFQEVNWF
jgi:hypothetical protein